MSLPHGLRDHSGLLNCLALMVKSIATTRPGASLKGITIYGDDSNYAALVVQCGKVCLISRTRGDETIVYQAPCKGRKIILRCEVDPSDHLRFSWKDRGKWIDVPSDLSATALIQWDRMFRPGLIHRGKLTDPGTFEYFSFSL